MREKHRGIPIHCRIYCHFYDRLGVPLALGVETRKQPDMPLSYDIAVMRWRTSCHKNGMTTRVITLWCVDITSLTTSMSTMRFLAEILLLLWAFKSHLKDHMINKILHLWSFHIKFMKLAKGSFS